MKFFRFDPKVNQENEQLGSVKAVIANILRMDNSAKINAVYLHSNERINHQQTSMQQLFLVVEGEGWIKSGAGEIHAIRAGQAVFWEANEIHESGTETGLTAVIIEGQEIDPTEFEPHLQEDKP